MISELQMRLMKSFIGSFINHNGEFIAHAKANEYFNLGNCRDELEVKCKVLEWLSRSAHKGELYRKEKLNEEFRRFMLDGINKFLDTHFNEEDIAMIYQELGNQVNRELTKKFILNKYDMNILENGEGGEVDD